MLAARVSDALDKMLNGRNRKSVEICTIQLLLRVSVRRSLNQTKSSLSKFRYFHFLLSFSFFFTQVGIVNGGGSRVLGVTNGPETAASLLAAGLDARAAELVSRITSPLEIRCRSSI